MVARAPGAFSSDICGSREKVEIVALLDARSSVLATWALSLPDITPVCSILITTVLVLTAKSIDSLAEISSSAVRLLNDNLTVPVNVTDFGRSP